MTCSVLDCCVPLIPNNKWNTIRIKFWNNFGMILRLKNQIPDYQRFLSHIIIPCLFWLSFVLTNISKYFPFANIHNHGPIKPCPTCCRFFDCSSHWIVISKNWCQVLNTKLQWKRGRLKKTRFSYIEDPFFLKFSIISTLLILYNYKVYMLFNKLLS